MAQRHFVAKASQILDISRKSFQLTPISTLSSSLSSSSSLRRPISSSAVVSETTSLHSRVFPSQQQQQRYHPRRTLVVVRSRSLATNTTTTTKEETNNNDDQEDKEQPEWRNPNVPEWDRRVEINEFKEGEEIPFANLPDLNTEEGKVLATRDLHDLAEKVINMPLKDVVLLTNLMQTAMGITDEDLRLAVGGGSGGNNADAAAATSAPVVEEKTKFDLKLTGYDAKSKIKVIKEVRAMTGLGLKEAKDMVEGAPKVLKKDIKKEEAEELKQKLEAVGGTVDIE